MEEALDFAEDLPVQCPPSDAIDTGWEEIYRLVKGKNPDSEAFKSHAALGKPCPGSVDLCRWSSCSLLLEYKAKRKLPRFKGYLAARLKIPLGKGMSKKTKEHVDFWRSSGYELSSSVIEVLEL